MMTSVGYFNKFNHQIDNWNIYQEQLEQFFVTNNIGEPLEGESDKRVSHLVQLIDSESYKILRDLCAPDLPGNKEYHSLCDILRKHFSTPTCTFRERIKFYDTKHQKGESVMQWYNKINQLSANCEFGIELQSKLKDKFVCSMKPGKIRDRLCEEKYDTTLDRLKEIALSKEIAIKEKGIVLPTVNGTPGPSSISSQSLPGPSKRQPKKLPKTLKNKKVLVKGKIALNDLHCPVCNNTTVLMTVRKNGLNKGRQFYKCASAECDRFFLWADEGNPLCKCNQNAILKTLNVGENAGKKFYRCAKSKDSGACGFFQWAHKKSNKVQKSNKTNQQTSNDKKPNKCSVCREPGHTKKNCPLMLETQ